MADIYTLYALRIGATVIDQILSQNIDPGLTEMMESGDSSLDNEHVSASAQTATIRFGTSAIAEALDAAGVSGLVIDEANDSNGIDLWFRKRAMGGGFESGEDLLMVVNLGILVPVTLTANHPDRAEIEYVLHLVWDGTNDPVTITKDQTVAALAPTITDIHTIGPWWINNTQLLGMRNFSVNFGLNVATKSSDGDVWPRSAHIESRGASMTGSSSDLAILDDVTGLGIMGIVQSGGQFGIRAFLRKKEQGAGVLIDGNAQHIRFSVAEGRVSPSDFGGDHQADGTVGLLVTPSYDGTNQPIVYTKDVAVA